MQKRILSCLIVVCMLLTLFPCVSNAEESEKPKLLTVHLWNTQLYKKTTNSVDISEAVSEITKEGVSDILQGKYFLSFSVYQDKNYRIVSFKHNDTIINESDMQSKMTTQNISDNPLWPVVDTKYDYNGIIEFSPSREVTNNINYIACFDEAGTFEVTVEDNTNGQSYVYNYTINIIPDTESPYIIADGRIVTQSKNMNGDIVYCYHSHNPIMGEAYSYYTAKDNASIKNVTYHRETYSPFGTTTDDNVIFKTEEIESGTYRYYCLIDSFLEINDVEIRDINDNVSKFQLRGGYFADNSKITFKLKPGERSANCKDDDVYLDENSDVKYCANQGFYFDHTKGVAKLPEAIKSYESDKTIFYGWYDVNDTDFKNKITSIESTNYFNDITLVPKFVSKDEYKELLKEEIKKEEEPTTEQPTTETPTTEQPTTEQPTTEAPIIDEEPTTESPTTEDTTIKQDEIDKQIKITKKVKASISSVKIKSRKATIKVKNKIGYNYEFQYSTSSKFKSGVKSIKTTKTSYKTPKLKKNKKYYFRARVYKKIDGKTYYGKWSTIKKVKVK